MRVVRVDVDECPSVGRKHWGGGAHLPGRQVALLLPTQSHPANLFALRPIAALCLIPGATPCNSISSLLNLGPEHSRLSRAFPSVVRVGQPLAGPK